MSNNLGQIEFINHASVILRGQSKAILTDPWYKGDVFNKGWNLLYENNESDIADILRKISHIWLSHEHPDHFSVPFFKKYQQLICELGIEILFQKTIDGRVSQFLTNQGFLVRELVSNEQCEIEPNFIIKIIKDEFYDSALIAIINNLTIFNLNDCPIHTHERLNRFKKAYGTCDILLTQFSYAAWKGGEKNLKWRKSAAKDKLNSLLLQGSVLNAKLVIPFASFVWFSNKKNFYLNDSINTPTMVLDFCKINKAPFTILFMAPYEKISLPKYGKQNLESLEFWKNNYSKLDISNTINFKNSFSFDNLSQLFTKYRSRIIKKNALWLIQLLSKLPMLNAFKPVSIYLEDLNLTVLIDIPSGLFSKHSMSPDISMHSESLAFIFSNPFGFDTLTVNGCFNEINVGGFSKLSKNFALENLNNLGIYLTPIIIFNTDVIFTFINRLIKVREKMKASVEI